MLNCGWTLCLPMAWRITACDIRMWGLCCFMTTGLLCYSLTCQHCPPVVETVLCSCSLTCLARSCKPPASGVILKHFLPLSLFIWSLNQTDYIKITMIRKTKNNLRYMSWNLATMSPDKRRDVTDVTNTEQSYQRLMVYCMKGNEPVNELKMDNMRAP